MKPNEIKNYLLENYGECRHNEKQFSEALIETAKEFNLDTFKLFKLIVENIPIEEAYTHSYGFQTANGREIIDTFKFFYNNDTNQD
tara:strand:- start:109 stop:366 length:258 start_codon:yes stop_codon:yes gene_type:complete